MQSKIDMRISNLNLRMSILNCYYYYLCVGRVIPKLVQRHL